MKEHDARQAAERSDVVGGGRRQEPATSPRTRDGARTRGVRRRGADASNERSWCSSRHGVLASASAEPQLPPPWLPATSPRLHAVILANRRIPVAAFVHSAPQQDPAVEKGEIMQKLLPLPA